VVITGIIDEYHPHDTIKVIGILVIDGDASLVLEGLTNPSLEKIFVEFRKKEGVQWGLTLLNRVEVEIITHLIYTSKKIICR
jgi:hypothetical protein